MRWIVAALIVLLCSVDARAECPKEKPNETGKEFFDRVKCEMKEGTYVPLPRQREPDIIIELRTKR